MITVMLILAVAALITTILSFSTSKVPLWVPVVLLALYCCLQVLPKG